MAIALFIVVSLFVIIRPQLALTAFVFLVSKFVKALIVLFLIATLLALSMAISGYDAGSDLGPSHPHVFATLAIIGLACCIALSLGGGGYVVYLADLQHARNRHVEFAMSHLPNGIPDRDKAIFKTELGWYFDGEYDRINASDLDTRDIYLQRIDPSLVRHKLPPK
jgi:hypothetical protein